MRKMKTISPLSIENLTVGYRTQRSENILFENLNLSLSPAQLVCFMGPNGSGKSTLIRTLAGLQKPLAGNVRSVNGTAGGVNPKAIGVVLTDKVASLSMTAYEVIAFGRYPYLNWKVNLSWQDEELIERAIRQIHIDHLRHKRLYELSDGQLQMVMIARALAQDTPVILLDEPTAHLDLNNRVEIMKFLHQLSRSTNKAILISTHELDLALQTADLIWLTGNKKNILTGIPEDLVLNGSFDEIFKFKGFDLKTGKVQHEVSRQERIHLTGSGYEFLWTKNALERNGFEVTHQPCLISIVIQKTGDSFEWQLTKEGQKIVTKSLTEILERI
jgi:iron complex transport system ATP-binding protein